MNVYSFEIYLPRERLIERCLNRDIYSEASIVVTTVGDTMNAQNFQITFLQTDILPL